MKGMPFPFGAQGFSIAFPEICEDKWKKVICEPTSVLDSYRSPSPTSTSILSSSLGGGSGGGASTDTAGGAGAIPGQKWPSMVPPAKDGWPIELIGKCSVPMDEWDHVMIESAGAMEPPDNTLLGWMSGETEEPLKLQQGIINTTNNRNTIVQFDDSIDVSFQVDPVTFGFPGTGLVDSSVPGLLPTNALMGASESVSKLNPGIAVASKSSLFSPVAGNFHQQQPVPKFVEVKPQIFPFVNPDTANLGLYLPEMPTEKRHQAAFGDPGQELFLGQQQLKPQQRQQQYQPPHPPQTSGLVFSPSTDNTAQLAVMDQLHQAAELVEARNFPHARAILARLNHHLPSPVGKPLYRAAFYFKEALNNLLACRSGSGGKPPPVMYSPKDVVLRISAYKAFCEVSPLAQFTSLTCNQALLEAIDGPCAIHIFDFDIGFGGHWASFMQEIMPKTDSAAQSSLKITAFTSSASHNQLELALTNENLSNFACLLGIPFQFNAVDLDSLDPSFLMNLCSPNEVVFANFPVSVHHLFASTSLPLLLRFLRQLSPRLVVSVDHACDRTELSFSQHFLQGLQFYCLIFESLDVSNANPDTLRKVESILLKPKIETMVSSRYQSTEKLLAWKNIFKSAEFLPVPFSNYTETQAECLVRRLQSRGFHVEKQQGSLVLFWQRYELASTSVWRC